MVPQDGFRPSVWRFSQITQQPTRVQHAGTFAFWPPRGRAERAPPTAWYVPTFPPSLEPKAVSVRIQSKADFANLPKGTASIVLAKDGTGWPTQ